MSSIIPSSIGIIAAGDFAPMTFTVDTTKAGSASDTFILPCGDLNTYDAIIDWGDSSTSAITTYNDADLSHTYSSGGTYTVKITGRLPWINFATAGDYLKIGVLSQWGDVVIESGASSYNGCSNLTVTATDAPTITATDLSRMFKDCVLANPIVTAWDISTATDILGIFFGCVLANPTVTSWDVSNVTNMSSLFSGASVATPNVTSWNTSSATNMSSMFRDALLAEPNISSWNVSTVTQMVSMFDGALVANPIITSWTLPLVTDMSNMFDDSGLSTANYDIALNTIDGQSHQSSVVLGASGVNYTIATSGTARGNLVTDSWVITDAGGI